MIPIPMGVVQFNSFEDSRATIKQTVADKIWWLNGVSNFVGLRATESFKVVQFELAWFDLWETWKWEKAAIKTEHPLSSC